MDGLDKLVDMDLDGLDPVTSYDARDDESNPFDRDALHLLVDKPVNDSQLKHEIDTALGTDVSISMKDTRVPGQKRVWITPVIDEGAIKGLVEAHERDPQWGITAMDEALISALVKLRSGATLTTKEISLVLRGMM
jgi:hypothetical protein